MSGGFNDPYMGKGAWFYLGLMMNGWDLNGTILVKGAWLSWC